VSVKRRRGPGEGNIRQRSDGRWEGRLTVGRTADGRQQTRSVFGRTRAETVGKLDALKAQIGGGLPAPDQRTTVGRYLVAWLDLVEPRLRPATIRRYRQIVEHQLIPNLGRVKLAGLAPSDVSAMMARVQSGGLSARSATHAKAVLRAALADAVAEGIVVRNAAALAKSPHVPPPSPKVLSSDEARKLVAAVADPAIQRMAVVALGSGLRQGELLGLRWSDVDLKGRAIHVRSVLIHVAGEYRLAEPKSASSRRVVPVGAHVVEALEAERRAQVEGQLAAGRRWRPPIEDLVFTTPAGQPRNGTSITHSLQDALQRAGLPSLTWHNLRAAHGAFLLSAGVDIQVVSRQLGHSSLSVTARHYGGVADHLGRDAADKLEALLGTVARAT
jgi:integrase